MLVANTLTDAVSVPLETAIYRLACTRHDNDTLVAFANQTSVSLQRLALPLRLKPIATSSDLFDIRGLLTFVSRRASAHR